MIDVYEDAGMYLGPYLYMIDDPKGKEAVKNPAFELGGKIHINSKGGLGENMSQKYNLLSTMFHENIHRNDTDGVNSFLEHALVYFDQIRVPQAKFSLCTEEKQRATISGMCYRFLSHIVNTNDATYGTETEILNYINEFNGYNLGYTLVADFDQTYLSAKFYKININLGNGSIIPVKYDAEIKGFGD